MVIFDEILEPSTSLQDPKMQLHFEKDAACKWNVIKIRRRYPLNPQRSPQGNDRVLGWRNITQKFVRPLPTPSLKKIHIYVHVVSISLVVTGVEVVLYIHVYMYVCMYVCTYMSHM